MAVNKITFADKITDGGETPEGRVTASDINDIKTSVNDNADELTATTAIAQAATPLLQAETAAYINRVRTAGSYVTANEANALDTWVVKGKSEGWFNSIKFFAPCLGTNLAASLVKFVIGAEETPSMTSTLLTEANYIKDKGLYVTSNANNKKVSTGFIPANNGISGTNMGVFYLTVDDIPAQAPAGLIGDNPISGLQNFAIYATGNVKISNAIGGDTVGGKRMLGFSIPNTTFRYEYVEDVLSFAHLGTTSNTPVVIDTEITIFNTRAGGTTYNEVGSVAGLLFHTGISDSTILTNMARAFRALYEDLGRIKTRGATFAFLGDSMSKGYGVTLARDKFTRLVCANLGANEYTIAAGGSAVASSVGQIFSFLQRYVGIVNPYNTMVIEGGGNDLILDPDVNGDPTIISNVQNSLISMIRTNKVKVSRTVVLPPSWNNQTSLTKIRAYSLAMANTAVAEGAIVVDIERLMTDTGSPATYFFSDGIHPNTLGHALIGQLLTSVLTTGNVYRNLPLDFPSIAAGGSQDLTVTILGARAGQICTVGEPAVPIAGIIYKAFVSADNTVTVRAINITGSPIDPTSQQFKVSVRVI